VRPDGVGWLRDPDDDPVIAERVGVPPARAMRHVGVLRVERRTFSERGGRCTSVSAKTNLVCVRMSVGRGGRPQYTAAA